MQFYPSLTSGPPAFSHAAPAQTPAATMAPWHASYVAIPASPPPPISNYYVPTAAVPTGGYAMPLTVAVPVPLVINAPHPAAPTVPFVAQYNGAIGGVVPVTTTMLPQQFVPCIPHTPSATDSPPPSAAPRSPSQMTMPASAVGIHLNASLVQPPTGRRPILADRYRTRMCKNHTADKPCPYRWRCMFAHSEEELRSAESNFAEGAFSVEAIRTLQDRDAAARRRQRREVHREVLRQQQAEGQSLTPPSSALSVGITGSSPSNSRASSASDGLSPPGPTVAQSSTSL